MLENRHLFGPAVPRAFYARDVRTVARELLGLILVRRQGSTLKAGRIVEVEAYGRQGDRASHATSGKTRRNAVMFGPPGKAYVYFTYGMHWLLNVVAERAGKPAAVLLRGVELLLLEKTLILGPARLTKAFAVTGEHNGEDLTRSTALWIAYPRKKRPRGRILRTPRIGVDYAGRAARWHRRFVLATAVPAKKLGLGHSPNPRENIRERRPQNILRSFVLASPAPCGLLALARTSRAAP